jgi:hypothetical protein
MKKSIYFAAVALLAAFFSSCEEWDPVFTGKYEDPGTYQAVTKTPNTTIAELKALYTKTGQPVKIDRDILIGGRVISEDRSGNIYRSLYIQDETGAIEIKLGKSGLYNDYKPGQWVYVDCSGLSIGNYRGMLQLGFQDPTGEYETTYLDVDYLIRAHVFRGRMDTPVTPAVLTENDLITALRNIPHDPRFGTLVTLKGLRYGCNESQYSTATQCIFCLIYGDAEHSKEKRIFLSDGTYGVTTWAMSKPGFIRYLMAGNFDTAVSQDGTLKVSNPAVKEWLKVLASAYAVSQYFLMGDTEVQVRTSGYARFADTQIDPAVLDGTATLDITGILSTYNGAIQFTLLDLDGVRVQK